VKAFSPDVQAAEIPYSLLNAEQVFSSFTQTHHDTPKKRDSQTAAESS